MKYQTIAIVTSYVKCGLIFANIIDSNLGHARGHGKQNRARARMEPPVTCQLVV